VNSTNPFVDRSNEGAKGKEWMPRLSIPTKDVAGCDKPRRASQASFDPGISEWGNPTEVMFCYPSLRRMDP
jgi:hypothetical protein